MEGTEDAGPDSGRRDTEADPNRTMMGFGELPTEAPDGIRSRPPGRKREPNEVMFGVDMRGEAAKALREALARGEDDNEIEKLRDLLKSLQDAAVRQPEKPPEPTADVPRPPEPRPSGPIKVSNPVRFFGPEIQEQIRQAGERIRTEQKKKKGVNGWLRRLLGR